MNHSLAALLCLLCFPLGCTVKATGAADDLRPKNTCQQDSDCDNDNCNQGVCQTLNGKIEALLVTAVPVSDSTIPHLTFVTQVLDVPTSGASHDLVFPGPSHLTGSFELPKGETCYPSFPNDDPKSAILPAPDGKSLPVGVTLSLSERLLGLPQQLFYATTSSQPVEGSYNFQLLVPSGRYDVYLVPPMTQEGPCVVPPQLYRNSIVEGASTEYPWILSPVATLTVHVGFPAPEASGLDLKGWSVDLIEPVGGNPISTRFVLGEPKPPTKGRTTVDYVAPLRYSSVAGAPSGAIDVQGAQDLVRLTPPATLVAPSLLFDRAGLSLFDPSEADIEGFSRYPSPVTIEGQLVRRRGGAAVGGQIYLQSKQIYGVDEGIFATYATKVDVGETGLFRATLPPGLYAVQALPPSDGGLDQPGALAAGETTWDIPAEPSFQAGRVVEFAGGPKIIGQSKFRGAEVRAAPTPTPLLTFDKAFGDSGLLPRSVSALVDESGHFALETDPGRFDISVQAPDSLGFARFVRPGVDVQDGTRDLGRVGLPRPALFHGKAWVDLGGTRAPLGSASIHAYAYLDKDLAYTRDPKQAVSLIEVAETRAQVDGSFRLLIPESIGSN